MGKFISSATNMTYSGHWKDGLKDGQGSLYFPSGDIITGKRYGPGPHLGILPLNSESLPAYYLLNFSFHFVSCRVLLTGRYFTHSTNPPPGSIQNIRRNVLLKISKIRGSVGGTVGDRWDDTGHSYECESYMFLI
jgi:hypothetical protein